MSAGFLVQNPPAVAEQQIAVSLLDTWNWWQLLIIGLVCLPWTTIAAAVLFRVVDFKVLGVLRGLFVCVLKVAAFSSLMSVAEVTHPMALAIPGFILVSIETWVMGFVYSPLARAVTSHGSLPQWQRRAVMVLLTLLPVYPATMVWRQLGEHERATRAVVAAQFKQEQEARERARIEAEEREAQTQERLEKYFSARNFAPVECADGRKVLATQKVRVHWIKDFGPSGNQWIMWIEVGEPVHMLAYSTRLFSSLGTPSSDRAESFRGWKTLIWTAEIPKDPDSKQGGVPVVRLDDLIEGIPTNIPELISFRSEPIEHK